MHVTFNGTPLQLAAEDAAHPLMLAELLRRQGLGERRVAVEINRQIVPRSQHGTRTLAEGDIVELVQAMGGG